MEPIGKPEMRTPFPCDPYLRQSRKEIRDVRPVAQRLQPNGLKARLEESAPEPGDITLPHVEERLKQSHAPVLCMLVNTFISYRAQLGFGILRFRDALNKARCVIPAWTRKRRLLKNVMRSDES